MIDGSSGAKRDFNNTYLLCVYCMLSYSLHSLIFNCTCTVRQTFAAMIAWSIISMTRTLRKTWHTILNIWKKKKRLQKEPFLVSKYQIGTLCCTANEGWWIDWFSKSSWCHHTSVNYNYDKNSYTSSSFYFFFKVLRWVNISSSLWFFTNSQFIHHWYLYNLR